ALRDVLEDSLQAGDVIPDLESKRDDPSTAGQLRPRGVVREELHDAVSEACRRWWISRDQVAVLAVDQPFPNPADVESDRRYSAQTGLNADLAERLGPQARHDKQ